MPTACQSRASAAARLERLPFSGYHRTIFIIIAIAFFFDSVDLGTMTFVLGSIKTEFGLSTATAGLVASASFFGMVGGAAVAGLLADRFGRRPVFQWSMVLWGLASYLCSTAQSVEALIFYRVLLGFGMGMEFPIAQTLLSEFVPASSRGRLIALMDGFWPLGFITAGVCRTSCCRPSAGELSSRCSRFPPCSCSSCDASCRNRRVGSNIADVSVTPTRFSPTSKSKS